MSSDWHLVAGLVFLVAFALSAPAAEDGWIDLSGKGLAGWKTPTADWQVAGEVAVDPNNPRRLVSRAGTGILVNGPRGRTRNLLSKQKFGDVEVHLEFFIPKGSNSGVKLEGLYEIQICDSWGLKTPKGSDCGGIYPRAELKPRYHYLDKGVPPRTNACRPPGQWQTLDAVFRAPRFDAEGKKTASARFVKVVLNGKLIHENVEVKTPTGHAWHQKEIPTGPLLLQADHGPVAFRNVRVRPLEDKAANK
jgi:hypothetical protein